MFECNFGNFGNLGHIFAFERNFRNFGRIFAFDRQTFRFNLNFDSNFVVPPPDLESGGKESKGKESERRLQGSVFNPSASKNPNADRHSSTPEESHWCCRWNWYCRQYPLEMKKNGQPKDDPQQMINLKFLFAYFEEWK